MRRYLIENSNLMETNLRAAKENPTGPNGAVFGEPLL